MKLRRLLLAALPASVLACSDASTTSERQPASASDGGTDAEAASPQPAPNGGRDAFGPSCYAACQNAGFTCQQKGAQGTRITAADLTPEAKGCRGTLTTDGAAGPIVALVIDCTSGQICHGRAPGEPATDCVSGTFSAFSFAFEPTASAPQNVCTRD